MNKTNATITATAGAAEVRKPEGDLRPAPIVRLRSDSQTEGQHPQTQSQSTGQANAAAEPGVQAPGSLPPVPSAARPAARSHRLAVALLAALVTTTATWSAWRWWDYSHTWVKTDNAYVATHVHQVSSRVAGTVSEVLVQDNQLIEAGQVIARLDARDFDVKRQQALAQAAQARAQVQQAQAQIAQAQAQVTREQAQANKAQQDLERAKALSRGANGAISKQELDAAQAGADAASAALQAADSGRHSATALAAAAEAQEKVAQANLRDSELQLSYTEIRAPVAGRIGKKNLEIGNRVQAGQALLALVQPEVWVVANFKETQLTDVKPGQPVRLRLDAFPGRIFQGKVDSLAPASGAQFALLPPDNATGNFTRIVQRVPVKIALATQDSPQCDGRIVPGMSAIAEVKVRE